MVIHYFYIISIAIFPNKTDSPLLCNTNTVYLYSDEPPLETELHLRQIILLFKCLEWLWQDRKDFYAVGNLTIYYSPHQKKSEYF